MDELSKLNLDNDENNIEKIKDNDDNIIDENNEKKDINDDIIDKKELRRQKKLEYNREFNRKNYALNKEKIIQLNRERGYSKIYSEKNREKINERHRNQYDDEKKKKKHEYYLKRKEKKLVESNLKNDITIIDIMKD